MHSKGYGTALLVCPLPLQLTYTRSTYLKQGVMYPATLLVLIIQSVLCVCCLLDVYLTPLCTLH